VRVMQKILGYLRHYVRWDGRPGVSIKEQRSMINWIARTIEEGDELFATRRIYHVEAGKGWSILRKLVEWASEDPDCVFLIVPTLDGVRFNLSFLQILVSKQDASICVYGGRLKNFTQPKTRHFREMRDYWFLHRSDHWSAFNASVERITWQQRYLPEAISGGIRRASESGILMGGARKGAYKFKKSDLRKGGETTARSRRIAANEPYENWIADIRRWRRNGQSIGQITRRLAERGARKPDGSRIGPMLVYRILKRINVL
jgi:hypothetical protein